MASGEDEQLKRQIERTVDAHKPHGPEGQIGCACGRYPGSREQHAVHLASVIAEEVEDFYRRR